MSSDAVPSLLASKTFEPMQITQKTPIRNASLVIAYLIMLLSCALNPVHAFANDDGSGRPPNGQLLYAWGRDNSNQLSQGDFNSDISTLIDRSKSALDEISLFASCCTFFFILFPSPSPILPPPPTPHPPPHRYFLQALHRLYKRLSKETPKRASWDMFG